ncbi:hypothetical protein D915_010176 [Fasciola hepatica]|uniref:Uncharacterized protein n=1 Tax=Fasciola hepatica TaxID=6192 RepID=A0A4E0QUZ4_FASHE|nr:hypothetical protein D915_010176 [Fasciola hepatica]
MLVSEKRFRRRQSGIVPLLCFQRPIFCLLEMQWCTNKLSSNNARIEHGIMSYYSSVLVYLIQNRVMDAMKRCRALTEKATTAQLRPDKEAASRFIKHALWQSAHSKAKKRRTETEEGSSR